MNAHVYELSHGDLDEVSGGLPTLSLEPSPGKSSSPPVFPTPIIPIPIQPVGPFPAPRPVGFQR